LKVEKLKIYKDKISNDKYISMVEKPIKKCYECNICNKQYKDKSGLWYHNNKYHSNNDSIMTSNDFGTTSNDFERLQNENQIKCKYCERTFTRKNNLNYHIKNTCKERQKKELEESIYKQELEKLKKEFEKFKKQKTSKVINYNINNGSINSNNNSNNSNKTLNLCQPGKENINLLTDTEKQFILSQGMNSIVSLVEHLNFNERMPQHHQNLYYKF
jgi:CRISPR/Cas system-associated protein endoribonuclease Cas2